MPFYRDGATPASETDADLGETSDAAQDPSGSVGALHAKMRGAGTQLDTIEQAVDTEVAAIKAKTDNLPAAPASQGDAQTGATAAAADVTGTTTVAQVVGNKADTAPAANDALSNDWGLARLARGLWNILKNAAAADDTTAAATSGLAQTVGRKDDTAATSIGTTTTVMRYVKAILAATGFWTGPTNATVSCAASSTTTLVEVTSITKPTQVIVSLNLKNLTQSATLQVQEHVYNGSTTEYQIVDPVKSWTTADKDGIRLEFFAQADYKVEIVTGAEGASRDVYVRHSRRVTA